LEAAKGKLPADLDDNEQAAIETGLANGLRARLFAEIENATRTFALPRLTAGDDATRRALTAAIDRLEHDVGLLRLNLNESAALENSCSRRCGSGRGGKTNAKTAAATRSAKAGFHTFHFQLGTAAPARLKPTPTSAALPAAAPRTCRAAHCRYSQCPSCPRASV
jgi:hypothetical protein